jgi:hypothetical protein
MSYRTVHIWPHHDTLASRAVAREILLRHPETAIQPSLRTRLSSLVASLQRLLRPKSEPPLPLAGLLAPLRRGPGGRSSGIALREP